MAFSYIAQPPHRYAVLVKPRAGTEGRESPVMPTGIYPRPDLPARFWSKVNKAGPVHPTLETACWVWLAATRDGYGEIGIAGRSPQQAHRIAWEMTVGPIPDGFNVLHNCDNPPCVNPSHLFLGTKKDNTQDMIAKGRSKLGLNQAEKTHCPRSHPYDDLNTIYWRNGGRLRRRCGECARTRERVRWASRQRVA